MQKKRHFKIHKNADSPIFVSYELNLPHILHPRVLLKIKKWLLTNEKHLINPRPDLFALPDKNKEYRKLNVTKTKRVKHHIRKSFTKNSSQIVIGLPAQHA